MELLRKSDTGGDSTYSKTRFSLLLAKSAINFVESHKNERAQGLKNEPEQLEELDRASQYEIEWKIDGNRIVPNRINVAKISRDSFAKTLSFGRITQPFYDS